MDTPERLPAKVLAIERLGPHVVGFQICCEAPGFSWLPGQYVELGLFDTSDRAAYSIASAVDPRAPGTFDVAASTRGQSFLLRSEAGSKLWITPAKGNFVRAPASGPSLFVAVGTGVTPLRAMIQSEFDQVHRTLSSDAQVLLFGCRRAEEILFRQEFEALALAHPRFNFIPTLTEPGESWSGARGRVQGHLPQLLVHAPPVQAFVCGKPEMAISVCEELTLLGLSAEDIHSQSY